MAEHLSDAWLYQYIDGELDLAANAAQVDHLQQCASCRQRLQRAEELFNTIESIPRLQRAHSLAPAVVKRVRAETGRRRRLWRLAAAQAAMALLVIGMLAGEASSALAGATEQLAAEFALNPTVALAGWWGDLQQEMLVLSNALQTSIEQVTQLPTLAGGEVPWLMVVIAGAGLWLLINGLWLRQDTRRVWPALGQGKVRHG